MEEMNVLSLDSEDILEYKLDGQFHIWPLVRFDLLTAISRQGAAGSPQRRVSAKTRLGNLLRGLSGIRIGRARIQFISSTLFCVKQSDTYTNVLEDYFFDVFPDDSFVYENLDPLDYSRRLPRKNHQISTAFTYVDLLGKGIARFFRAGANGDIDAFCRHLSAKGVRQDFVDETRVNRRALSTSSPLRNDLVQQAFVSRIRELQSMGAELVNKDPNVKKALQEELNRVGVKYQLGADSVSKLGLSFENPKVESSFKAAYESITIKQLFEQVKNDEKKFLDRKTARQSKFVAPETD